MWATWQLCAEVHYSLCLKGGSQERSWWNNWAFRPGFVTVLCTDHQGPRQAFHLPRVDLWGAWSALGRVSFSRRACPQGGTSLVCFVIFICLCCVCLPDCSQDRLKGAVPTVCPHIYLVSNSNAGETSMTVQGRFPDADHEAWVHGEVTTG